MGHCVCVDLVLGGGWVIVIVDFGSLLSGFYGWWIIVEWVPI